MNHQLLLQPLLADATQIITAVIVGLLMLARWVFSQAQDAKKQAARQRAAQQSQAQRGQQPRPTRPQGAPPPAGAPQAAAGQQADPLRDQVDAFLRRAAEQQKQNDPRAVRRPQKTPASNKIEILVGDESSRGQRKPLAEPFRSVGAVVSTNAPSSRTGGAPAFSRPPLTTVAEHVVDHVAAGTRELGQRSAQLGQRIITDDEQFDVQLKAKFDHAVGTLAASSPAGGRAAEAAPRETPADQLAAMLASPDGVRQAIVLNEILRRPTDRW